MADIIQLLPDHVANQIAAGEVIQRPASVVKELMENAIDAGASRIDLIIKDAGKTLIQVNDNGSGMSAVDARTSFERHATSKIKLADDLLTLHTKGFRGEALASIAAISHVTLKTKLHDAELGQEIKVEGSKVVEQEACQCTNGSSFAVKNLFYNVPARRNFLKSANVEFKHIQEEFVRLAYTHPDIHFTLTHNNKEVFQLQPTKLRQRIVAILGERFNERLVPVSEETDIVKINGFVTKPEYAKKTKGEQYLFINNRYIKNGYLHHAIMGAFEGFIPHKTYPSYFIYFQIDPKSIDINIHPTKTEVKFEEERAIYAILKSAIKQALGQFNAVPSLDFETETSFNPPPLKKGEGVQIPTVKVDPEYNPFKSKKDSNSALQSAGLGQPKATREDWENFYEVRSQAHEEVDQDLGFEEEEASKEMVNAQQLMGRYILTTLKSGVVLIDQKRAHERILFEQFTDQIKEKALHTQGLMFPEHIDLSIIERALLEQHQETLNEVGFQWEINKEGVDISGIPATASDANPKELFETLLAYLKNEDDAKVPVLEQIAKSMAVAAAMDYGKKLDGMEMNHIIDQLFACNAPYYSPSGKPTIITFTAEEIAKRFQKA